LAPHSHNRRSPTPSFAQSSSSASRADEIGVYYQSIEDLDVNEYVDDSTDTEAMPDYLTAEMYLNDPLSRSPSPLPSPLPLQYSEPPPPSTWNMRYDIHNEAFVSLVAALAALHDDGPPLGSRYVLMPVLILALVTRPGSKERDLCVSFINKFKSSMASVSLDPTGGEELDLNIPWDKLDAYSDLVEKERRDSVGSAETLMPQSAPEWNWWDMLKHTDMNMSCKCSLPSFFPRIYSTDLFGGSIDMHDSGEQVLITTSHSKVSMANKALQSF
jgi:hypothetical protein